MTCSRGDFRCPSFAFGFLILLFVLLQPLAYAEETSSGDKLRILYSSRFTFSEQGTPWVTVEIESGKTNATIRSSGGLWIFPDGASGSKIDGGQEFKLSAARTTQAKTKEWTIVETLDSNKSEEIPARIQKWKKKGLKVKAFQVGTLFSVKGTVMDSRQTKIGVSPVAKGKGEAQSRVIAKKYSISTEVYEELLKRPSGTIAAKNKHFGVENASVLWFKPKGPKATIEVLGVKSGHGGSSQKTRKENRNYLGWIYATVDKDGLLSLVNAVEADDLLAGLVPSEMFPTAPLEALKSQSIAARTELIQKLGTRHIADPYLLCSSQHCQVYTGTGREHPRTTKAVNQTRGVVMLNSDGGLVDARYSAACGGHSEHKHNIWGGEHDSNLVGRMDQKSTPKAFKNGVGHKNVAAFLKETKESYCSNTKFSKNRYRWNLSASQNDLKKSLAAYGVSVGKINRLTPIKRGISGRTVQLEVKGSNKTQMIYGDLKIRRALGGLRSSLFVVESTRGADNGFVFSGAGFGHGVGMCQLGAIGMANAGKKHSTILPHYYKDVILKELY